MLIKPDVQRFAKIRTFSFAVSKNYTAHFEEPCLFGFAKNVKVDEQRNFYVN